MALSFLLNTGVPWYLAASMQHRKELSAGWFSSLEPSLKRRDIQKLIYNLLENHSEETSPASIVDKFYPCNTPKTGNAIEFLPERPSPSKGCDVNSLCAQAEKGIEMTLFPASSLRVSHCANDSDTASTELFEYGSAAGSLNDLQYQAFDRVASFNELKNAMSSLQENVHTGANLVYSTSTENGFHHLGVITTEPCDYPSPRDFRTEVSCYQETSIQQTPHENLDLVPAPSVCRTENSLLVSVDEKCQVSRESSFNNQMDKITHKSIENVECLRDGLASAHSKTLEIADPYCSFQSFDRDNSDCLKACLRNLCESLNQGNGVGGNRDTTCDNTYYSAFESDVELAAKRLRLTPTSEELEKEPLQ